MVKAIISYLWSTVRHKAYVFYAGVFIVGKIPIWRLLVHDLSKFNPVEFTNYARYYKLFNKDEAARGSFVIAWMHHQKRNKHHPEYWTTVGIYDWSNGSVNMPETYVREWVADLLGASREYTGSWDMTDWLKENINRWDYVTPQTKKELISVLGELGYYMYAEEIDGETFLGWGRGLKNLIFIRNELRTQLDEIEKSLGGISIRSSIEARNISGRRIEEGELLRLGEDVELI